MRWLRFLKRLVVLAAMIESAIDRPPVKGMLPESMRISVFHYGFCRPSLWIFIASLMTF